MLLARFIAVICLAATDFTPMKEPSPRWLGLLPSRIRDRVEHRSGLLKIITNTGWLLFDRVFRMAVGLFVGVWVARYLGPEQFGAFNYAIAFVGLFSAIASLGLNGIVVRDVIRRPEEAEVTLGTAFVMQILGGLTALALTLVAVYYAKPGDTATMMMVVILGLSTTSKASEVIKYWFESKVQARSIVIVESSVFALISVLKVCLILTSASLMAFVWLVLAESLLIAAGLLGAYFLNGYRIANWRWQFERAQRLLADSWPLVLSGLAAMVYMRIDQIMLGQMRGDTEVGLFSAAVRISETCYIVPALIAGSVFPAIIEAKKHGEALYLSRLKKLFQLMAALSLLVALPISLMSDWIIRFLYGANFEGAASVLAIQVWASVFVFSGVASSRWFLVENLQKYSFYRTLAGAVINVLLNYIWIPRYGMIGAAWATLLSQAVASVLFNFSNAKTRPVFYMQIKAITGISFFQK